VSLAASTAAGTYEWWSADGSRHAGTISDAGTVTPGATPQTFNASVYRQFTLAGDADLVPGNIKDGVAIFGVSGLYPSSTYPLPDADDGGVTVDLDTAGFNARMKSSTPFQWWDPTGTRHVGSGDAGIVDTNVANGVSIFGTTGSLVGALACTGDGQTGCVSTSRYKSMDTSEAAISAWDVRAGKTAGGLAGKLVFYTNMADTTLFDRTSGTGGASGADTYDTIDDNRNGGAVPTQNPWSAPMTAPGANWLRDAASDTDTDGTCNGGEACVYRDLATGLLWQEDDGAARDWEAAITFCQGSSYGGYASGWRLPTQKELRQAYIDGIWLERTPLNAAVSPYWSSTTFSNTATDAWSSFLHRGDGTHYAKATTYNTMCVHP
jgi:hypothetical protein